MFGWESQVDGKQSDGVGCLQLSDKCFSIDQGWLLVMSIIKDHDRGWVLGERVRWKVNKVVELNVEYGVK